jgi:hypothetical protein
MFSGKVESQYLVGSFSPSGHSISSHSSGRGFLLVAVRWANAQAGEARGERRGGAV